MTTFKDVIRSVIDVTVKRTEKIDASAAHSNKKTSQLKSMAIEQAGRMRERSESLNSLKNGFAEVRHAIADTGIYHHLLKGKIREVDKLILSAYKISDIFGESASPKEFNKKLKQKETEYISKSQAEFGNKNSKLGKEYLEIATAIGKIKVFPESWYWFKLTDTELKSVSSVTSENKEKKMEDKVSIGAYNYIDVAKKLMADDYHIRRALGLCMLSGRRMSEMMVTGDFCATDDGNLLFSGAIKKDSLSLFSSTDEWHEIPSMIDADEFVHFFKKLRDDQKIQEVIELCKNQKSLSPVNKTFAVLASYNAKKCLIALNDSRDKKAWKFSDSRAMAVAVAYLLESKKPKGERIEDEVIFYKNYLIHADVEMMLNYREFFATDDSGDVDERTLLDKLHAADEEVLRQAARSKTISQDRFLKVHDSLCDYVSRNPDVKITKSLLRTPRKGGGIGADLPLSVAYYEIIKPFIG